MDEQNVFSTADDSCPRRRSVLRALGVGTVGVSGLGALAACGPDDQGFPQAKAVATDGGIPLSEIPENSTVIADFGSAFVAIIRGQGQDIRGMSGYCTHQGCKLALDDQQLQCPCHGSRFDENTGAPLGGPAKEPLAKIPLQIRDGKVFRA
ncbi:Rieske (2Fe-2S) protein [Devriesea agamarum]|uniref:Rieske (2Fe-2S) protein n=1 Tax=Devriesea agamarum TaxID=472569 RepID=UPI000A0142C4|nr:Rieske (2Fe-2S) protein [Devriesea agamarum]